MGQFFIIGPCALDLIQKVSSNDASKLSVGQAQYSCLPNDKGGIVDDLLIYRLGHQEYMLVVNASNIEKDLAWIKAADEWETTIEDRSDALALLAIQGPKATKVLQQITDINVSDIPYYHFKVGEVAGQKNVIVSATGYTGSGGYEVYLDNKDAVMVWKMLLEKGKEQEIKPIGLGARDTLRLEMGYCLYGNDINDDTSPIEAGLGWITKTKKDAEFFCKQLFKDQRKNGVKNKLVGFTVDDKRVPRQGYQIVDSSENLVGEVTSGTMSPSLNIPIGMG